MKHKIALLALITGTALASCTDIPHQAYFNRGQPESLLTVSSEEVTVSLEGPGGTRQLTDWIDRQQPAHAKLVCGSTQTCDKAAEVLDQFNVPYDQVDGSRDQVILTFEKVEARDCDNRFMDNHINPYNLNHPTFGCSVSVNTVQMVTDKNEFTNPKLLGQYDGQKATQNYDSYTSREKVNLDSGSFSPTGGGGGGSQ